MVFLESNTLLPPSLHGEDKARALHALASMHIAVEPELHGRWADAFAQLEWANHTALVCDNQTWEALGKTITDELRAAGYVITLLNLGSAPKPSDTTVEYVSSGAASCDALIAVGSGTINDITQHAAHTLNKPYVICGTAPSMNGYLSANAAIMVGGHKQSLPAALPKAALFDLSVLESAPKRLTQAGLGDSSCRSTAQADWLLSHLLLDTPYDALPFSLLALYEEAMLKGDMDALIKTLLLSGLGMTLASGSYPASQGEHLMAHYMEMMHPDAAESYHGEQIAITTLYMAKLQQRMLQGDAPTWKPKATKEDMLSHFGKDVGESVWQAYAEKCAAASNGAKRLKDNWPDVQQQIASITLPVATIQAALKHASAPTKPEDIGWTQALLEEAALHAPLIRNRFGFLDLA